MSRDLRPIGILKLLVRLSPNDNLVLAKQLFEFAPVILPPRTIERINHHLDDNYRVSLCCRCSRHPRPALWCTPLGRRTGRPASLGLGYSGRSETAYPHCRKPGEECARDGALRRRELGGSRKFLPCGQFSPAAPIVEQLGGVAINRNGSRTFQLVPGRPPAKEAQERNARPASSLSVILGVADHAGLRRADRGKSVQCQ